MFLGIDWSMLAQPAFWLNIRPGRLSSRFEVAFGAVLILSYALYGFSLYMERRELDDLHRLYALFWKRFSSFSLTMAVSFTFIFFFRYEGIPYLGGRLWMVLWLVGGVIWLIMLMKYYFRDLPKVMAEQAEKQAKLKYFKK